MGSNPSTENCMHIFHNNLLLNCIACLQRPKINEKEVGDGPPLSTIYRYVKNSAQNFLAHPMAAQNWSNTFFALKRFFGFLVGEEGLFQSFKSAFTKMYLDKRKREVGFLSSHIRQILLLSLSFFLSLSLSFFFSLPIFLSSRFLSILGCFSYIFLFKSLSPCISLPLSFVFFLNICLFPSIIL